MATVMRSPECLDDLDDTELGIIEQVKKEEEDWRTTLAVSIGHASKLTELKDTQIRYFETIDVLKPGKTTDQAGSSRLYRIEDLRRLRILALLLQRGHKSSEAAEFVKSHQHLIDHGRPRPRILRDMLVEEGSAITNGFLLSRLASQLLYAAQYELKRVHKDARVIGLMLPMERISVTRPEEAQEEGGDRIGKVDLLVAIDRAMVVPSRDEKDRSSAFGNNGQDDCTVLFYSDEPWEFPDQDRCQYCFYNSADNPSLTTMILLVICADEIEANLTVSEPRIQVFDRLLKMCENIFPHFKDVALPKNFRYRSDGYQIEHTEQAYGDLLSTIREVIFPEDDKSMACLLVPNSLDQPSSLSILAHSGYVDDLALRARLAINGAVEGLSGRAYKFREPFFSLDASNDDGVAYAREEGCQAALAVPLMISGGYAPFGVLYLASTVSGLLDSHRAYTALILGNILSEQLGRWWLTRLRRAQDAQLHEDVTTMIYWLDSMDAHGLHFDEACAALEQHWKEVRKRLEEEPQQEDLAQHPLALVVFDINQHAKRGQGASF